jgi:hypothetical protein
MISSPRVKTNVRFTARERSPQETTIDARTGSYGRESESLFSPPSVATATATSTLADVFPTPSAASYVALTFGDRASARATAYITQSFTLARTSTAFSLARNASTAARETSAPTKKCGD